MFGIFKNRMSISDYAKTSEIMPVAEDGDIAGFIVQINDSGKHFTASAKAGNGREEMLKFIRIIDGRIENGDYANIFKEVDEMLRDAGIDIKKRNLNAQRIVVCRNESVFRWVPGE
jgi:hypothetical protein